MPSALYRRLLGLLPRRLRDEHGAEMEAAFHEALSDARARGRVAVLATWLSAMGDIVRVSVHRRLRRSSALPSEFTHRSLFMRSGDLMFALRSFYRQPLPSLLVSGMLALGIAANIVVFSLVNGLFLRPFPFPDADRLVYVNETAPRWDLETTGINFPDYAIWRSSMTAFEGLALYGNAAFTISDEQGAERVEGQLVTANFFDVLGVRPIAGRTFTADDDRPGARRVILISERLWRERLGADPNLEGKTLRLNGVAMDVAGVMPHTAAFPENAKAWLALQGNPNAPGTNYSYTGIGRLKPGVSVEQAQADLLRAHAPTWETHDTGRNVSPLVVGLRERLAGRLRSGARTLSVAVALLLVVACANVAAVMLARAIARRREMGIRLAVGASRGRLMRQLLTENVLLAAAGGVAGLVLGRWLLTLLVTAAGDQLPAWAVFAPDLRLAGFAVVLTLVTALLFGWAPALHAVRGDLRSTMNDSVSGSTSSPGGARMLPWLVAAEFAMAAVLIVGAGLFVRAFDQVRRLDPGFSTSQVLTFSVGLPPVSYRDNPARLAFWNRSLERMRALPGVESAGLVTCAPLSNCHSGNFFNVEGRRPLAAGESNPVVLARSASDGYIEAMGIRLAAGRALRSSDGPDNLAVMVNESFIRTFWPGITAEQALGRRMSFNGNVPQWYSVVGVTRDVKHYGLEVPMRPGVYFPNAVVTRPSMTFAIRVNGDPDALMPSVRTAFRELDPSLAIFRMRSTATMLEESMRSRRLYSWTIAVFAGLALILALGGAYGVTSYLTTQRRREIGIRMAVGAGQRDVVRAILMGAARTVLPGLAAGVIGAVLLAGRVDDLLFGVSPREPMVLAISTVILLAAAFAANWLPARRAARTNPMNSLKA